MLIQLPVETWIEILDWLRRRDLVKKLDKLWDRQFTPIVQDWLHKYTKNVRFGRLWVYKDALYNGRWERVPFAEVDMPGNITGFERIAIRYLDSNILIFLRRLRPLFQNICLMISDELGEESLTRSQTALRAFMPLISGIGSIESLVSECKSLQFFSTNYQSVLFNAKLLQIWHLYPQNNSELLINWLFTPRKDGQARTLVFVNNPDGFWEKLRERFLDPTRQLASPFFFQFRNNLPNLPNALVIENTRTGEQLTVKGNGVFGQISNCPLNNVDPEWLAEKTEEMREWNVDNQQKLIWLDSPKLGLLDPIVDDPQQQPSSTDSSEENPQEKPGTSNAQNLEEEEEEPGKKRARLI